MTTYSRNARSLRMKIFETFMLDVGGCMPGCGVCIIVDKHGVYIIQSQIVCKAMNATIHAHVRRIFQKTPKKELIGRLGVFTGNYLVDVDKCVDVDREILERMHSVEELKQVHFCIFHFDCKQLVYRMRNTYFPLETEDIDEIGECIFKTWSEMQTANVIYGERLLHERV